MMQQITFKTLTAAEVPQLADLWAGLSAFHNQLSEVADFYPTVPDRESQAMLQRQISAEKSFIIGALADNQLIGFIQYTVTGRIGAIERLFVASSYRGQGIGKELLEHGLTALQQFDVHHLDIKVLIGNEAAKALYQRYGFQPRLLTLTKIVSDEQ